MTIPTVITKDGLTPTPPAVIRAEIAADVASTNPGYTANLPGSMIEDMLSTEVGSVSQIDRAVVETVGSLTPYGANAWLLAQQGNMLGIQQASDTRTSVFAIFSGPAGYVINRGFTVGDGTYQYVVQDGGAIGAGGESEQLFCVATTDGSWAVPTNTVTQLVTQPPTGFAITVTNSVAGIPAATAESEEQFRSRVLIAVNALSQGAVTYLKTLLATVEGVQQRLVSVRQNLATSQWEVICGGGDPYQVAYKIFRALFFIPGLTGSQLTITNITQAANGTVTTNLNHGYSTGQAVFIAGVLGMTPINGGPHVITVLTPKTFHLNADTSGMPAYVSGGILTPNLRDQTPAILDFPDTYIIPFVSPLQQSVTMTVTWNTTATNLVSNAVVSQLAAPALAAYVNSIYAGQPMNLFELERTFQEAVSSVIDGPYLTRMVFDVQIDGVSVPPESGTGIISGDPESFLFTASAAITISQG